MKTKLEYINGQRFLNGVRYIGTSSHVLFKELLTENKKATKQINKSKLKRTN